MTDKKSILIKEYFSKVKQANKEHKNTESFHKLFNNAPQKELTALTALLADTRLGKLRLDIKKHLSAEMKEIDGLVKRVVS